MKLFDFIGLKNFRVFDDKEGILEELYTINLFTGANNSGKSSIIKSFQLLKNSIAANKIPFDLDLTDQEHLLGDFENVLHNADNRNIEISLPFPFLGLTFLYAKFFYHVPDTEDGYKAHLRQITITDMSDKSELFSFVYRSATQEEITLDSKDYQEKKLVFDEKNKKDPEMPIKQKFILPEEYLPHYSELAAYIEWKIDVEKLKYYLSNLLPFYDDYLKAPDKDEFLENFDNNPKNNVLAASILTNSFKNKDITKSGADFLEKIKDESVLSGKYRICEADFDGEEHFIPPYKTEEVFYYHSLKILENYLIWINESEPRKNVIAHCFENGYKELVNKISEIHFISTVKEENSRIYLGSKNSPFINLLKDFSALKPDSEFLSYYLQAFEIGTKIDVDYEPKYQTLKVSILSNGQPARDLVDFGYGIKQLILILMQISVLAEKNYRQKEVYREDIYLEDYYLHSLLLVEEPETNLHPKWQSLLADMFAEANKKFNIQLIIETHSEYLIRKFQTLTAEKKIENTNIKIFYLRSSQKITAERKQLETTFIEEDGSIDYSIFDGGFFDESHKLELSLLNFQRDHFLADFKELKKSQKKDEEKIIELQTKIDAFTAKTDLSLYQLTISRTFDTSKLENSSTEYLTSGLYLFEITNDSSDFSPVILQHARAIENELCSIFRNVNSTKNWMMGVMQGSLEKYKSGRTAISSCSNAELALLGHELNIAFNTPLGLKVELLDDLRKQRNDAAHARLIKNKSQAAAYMSIAYDFLKKWIELKK